MSGEAAVLRAWDTAFFGLRIAHINGERLTDESARAVDEWCAENHIDVCVLLAGADDLPTAHAAVRHSYAMLDFRVVLDCDLTHSTLQTPRRPVRMFRDADLPELARIAGESFVDSRFYVDPYFPKARVPEMYRRWVHQRCGDTTLDTSLPPADAVIVAENADGQTAGFLICVLLPPDSAGQQVGSVDLVAVDSRARGQYIGESMVKAGLLWFAAQGCHTVEVVTQGRNIAAQRTYQRSGFAIRRAQSWYHKWRTHGFLENPV